MSVSTCKRDSLLKSSWIHPRLIAISITLPRFNSVKASGIGVVVLHACQDARGVVIKELRIWLFPAIGHCPAAHQGRRKIVSAVHQVLKGSNGTVTRMAIQHAVVTTKFILEPWPAAVVDVLGDRLKGLNDDRIKDARSRRVVLCH